MPSFPQTQLDLLLLVLLLPLAVFLISSVWGMVIYGLCHKVWGVLEGWVVEVVITLDLTTLRSSPEMVV